MSLLRDPDARRAQIAEARRGDISLFHRQGEQTAVVLGWPRTAIGWRASAADMLNLATPWRPMGSMLTLVRRRREIADAQVRLRTLELMLDIEDSAGGPTVGSRGDE